MNQHRELKISLIEFVVMMALLMSINAMAIDMTIPANNEVRMYFNLQEGSAEVSGIVSFYLIGLALGQIIYGPLSDSFGRKPAIFLGMLIFIISSIIAAHATSLQVMLYARLAQGLGGAVSRVLSITIIRDYFSGKVMAKIMSWIMLCFILIPLFAPTFGFFIISILPWQFIYYFFIIFSLLILLWIWLRLEEPLRNCNKKGFSLYNIVHNAKTVLLNKVTMLATIAMGLIFGILATFLTLGETMLVRYYQITGKNLIISFLLIVIAVAFGNLTNAKALNRFSINATITFASFCQLCFFGILLFFVISTDVAPLFLIFEILLMFAFFFNPMIFANINSIAMEPMGKMSGMASAIIGTFSTLIGSIISVIVEKLDSIFNNLILIFSLNASICSILCFLILLTLVKKTTNST